MTFSLKIEVMRISVKNNKSVFIFKLAGSDLELLLCDSSESLNKGSYFLIPNTSPILLVSVCYFIRPLLQICIIQCSFNLTASSSKCWPIGLNSKPSHCFLLCGQCTLDVSPRTLDIMLKF